MFTRPAVLLHLEGATVLVGSIVFYRHLHASWVWFVLLILAPDLSMLGYMANARVGAACYNFVHTLLMPGLLLGFGFFFGRPQVFPFALIWAAHIGADRLFGYGLKYPTRFKDTHLQHV